MTFVHVCAGGELFYRIVDMGHFSEVYASSVMGALLRGVKALHDAGIIRMYLRTQVCTPWICALLGACKCKRFLHGCCLPLNDVFQLLLEALLSLDVVSPKPQSPSPIPSALQTGT